jgi:hypothetical protein
MLPQDGGMPVWGIAPLRTVGARGTDTCGVARNGVPADEVHGSIVLHTEAQGDLLVVDEREPAYRSGRIMYGGPPGGPRMQGGCEDCRMFAGLLQKDASTAADRAWADQKAATTSRICHQVGRYTWRGDILEKAAERAPPVAPMPTTTTRPPRR